MSRLSEWLWRACSALGVRAELGFRLVLQDGTEVHTIARLPDLGAPKGMLLLASYDQVHSHSQVLLDAGYGYSVLNEPRPQEDFDLDSFRDMFKDWGWSGEVTRKPQWMQ